MTAFNNVLRTGLFLSLAVLGSGAAPPSGAPGRIDHVILGAADLDKAVDAFEKATGVRPVYGGKHPRGTHNALVSLGESVYLEILAVQPGASPPDMADLAKLERPTPVGWAVGASEIEPLRRALQAAGFTATPPRPGSRATPSGLTLNWQTFGLTSEMAEAPFFIVWDPGAKHPSTTAPAGCKLRRFVVAGSHLAELQRLRDALGLEVELRAAKAPAFSLDLACPKGLVSFGPS